MMRKLTLAAAMTVAATGLAKADPPDVAVDVAPVHSLVAGVMEGVGSPDLLVPPGGSPHGQSMRPSQAQALQGADLIFHVGLGLTPWLEDALQTVVQDARVITLADLEGTNVLPARASAVFALAEPTSGGSGGHGHDHGGEAHAGEGHGHEVGGSHAEGDHGHGHDAASGDHGHGHAGEAHGHSASSDGHSHDGEGQHASAEGDHAHEGGSHAQSASGDHGHDGDAHAQSASSDGHGHDGEAQQASADHSADSAEAGHDQGHSHGAMDPHLWLDPENALAWLDPIAAALAEADPDNAQAYRDNAERMAGEIETLMSDMSDTLAPVQDTPFVVFHDAYHYLEDRFGLSAAGSIAPATGTDPGAARMAEIRDRVQEANVACVFTEPQMGTSIVRTVAEGSNAQVAEIDPLGGDLTPGPALYDEMMHTLADRIAGCLSSSS